MAWDLSMDLMKATVQLEQPLNAGTRTVGTGFLVSAPTPDGKPRIVLVTAGHVFDKMPSAQARVGYRDLGPDGAWHYDPQALKIRNDSAAPLWTRHPTRDVAVMVVTAPPEFAKAAIPLAWLASNDTFDKSELGPGDELMALGFPRGLAANPAGFPILRAGRVASFPLGPAANSPTFLLDFAVFPGNSGGPVYMTQGARRRPGASEAENTQFIAGILTQQVELGGERLDIGIVTHASFIREAIELLDEPAKAAQFAAASAAAVPSAQGMGLLPAQAAASSN
jgi:hypothetical protein